MGRTMGAGRRRLVAGVDCSTQSTKVLVVDADSGAVVGAGRQPHEVTGSGGARETDPLQWFQALASALEQTGSADQVEAIAVAGQQHGLVVLDGEGAPLRAAMLWNDTRAAGEAAKLREDLGGAEVWAQRIGIVPVASFTVAKWAWLRAAEPDVAERTRAVRLPHDYLTERLAGAGATDRGDVSGTGWWSTSTEEYDADVLGLERVALDREMLPTVLGPNDTAGEVPRAVAERLGLTAGVVVAPGTGDNMAAALGLGLEPGTPVVSLGTSGTTYAVAEHRSIDATGTVAGFADANGRHLPLAATLNCTVAVDRFAALLGLGRDDVAATTGCVVLPYLDGERTPNLPLAAGSIVGLRHTTTGPEILRAAYEGAVVSLLDAVDSIDETGAELAGDTPLVLVGGGARGAAWQRVIADLTGRRIEIPEQSELVALGAAAQATAVLRGEDVVGVAARWRTRRGTTIEARAPDADRRRRIHEAQQLLADLNESRWPA